MFLVKGLFISLLLLSSLFAGEQKCLLKYSTMYIIAMNEKHKDKAVGYPYLISLNNKKDVIKAKEKYKNYFLDNRTIDCINKEKCFQITKNLIADKITNLDLGAFQINYKYHKIKIKDYFNLKKSYIASCKIASQYIKNKQKITFRDIAKYHSHTKKYNRLYADSLRKNYQLVLNRI